MPMTTCCLLESDISAHLHPLSHSRYAFRVGDATHSTSRFRRHHRAARATRPAVAGECACRSDVQFNALTVVFRIVVIRYRVQCTHVHSCTHRCITTGSGYVNGERCTINVLATTQLSVTTFSTEGCCDKLTLRAAVSPADAATASFTW